jgi:pSer/pThr/pTyr-binding forkhead associated (FHA) protein
VIVQPATEPLTAYALADGLTLGRGTQCSIVLNDSFLSGTHARIVHLDGQWTLEDLGSTNGTFVNGAAIGGSVLLGIGDQIQLGGIVIEVR